MKKFLTIVSIVSTFAFTAKAQDQKTMFHHVNETFKDYTPAVVARQSETDSIIRPINCRAVRYLASGKTDTVAYRIRVGEIVYAFKTNDTTRVFYYSLTSGAYLIPAASAEEIQTKQFLTEQNRKEQLVIAEENQNKQSVFAKAQEKFLKEQAKIAKANQKAQEKQARRAARANNPGAISAGEVFTTILGAATTVISNRNNSNNSVSGGGSGYGLINGSPY